MPTSFATRLTSAENARSWSTIVLTVSFSSSTSPLTSTVIFFERSPFATAVVTVAMFRTCVVRFDASPFTDSVRSFQVPLTPLTCAWPPSLPSSPTSRATRVTSSANEPSWSTIVLIVFFSSATSPRTSTVIFFVRSPFATAVVTCAMFRTCVVRFDASVLTLSVRSFQTPLTPFTFAWPPSLPSVPTSRATRVTSSANDESWSTIEFTVVPMRRNSPFTGCPSIVSCIFCERSPSATASITRATSVVGRTRSSISVFRAFVVSAQWPTSAGAWARSVRRPSRPMARPTRATSLLNASRRSASSLNARCRSAAMPEPEAGSRSWKLPSRAAWSAASSSTRSLSGIWPSAPLPAAAPFRDCGARLRGRLPPWSISCPTATGAPWLRRSRSPRRGTRYARRFRRKLLYPLQAVIQG